MENKNKILIDASHSEETRVVVLNNKEIDEYEFEVSSKKELKGNIYLAKVTKIEASLQAAFVDYGNKKQGFLPFSEINIHYFNISKDSLANIKQKQLDYRESLKAKFKNKKIKSKESSDHNAEKNKDFNKQHNGKKNRIQSVLTENSFEDIENTTIKAISEGLISKEEFTFSNTIAPNPSKEWDLVSKNKKTVMHSANLANDDSEDLNSFQQSTITLKNTIISSVATSKYTSSIDVNHPVAEQVYDIDTTTVMSSEATKSTTINQAYASRQIASESLEEIAHKEIIYDQNKDKELLETDDTNIATILEKDIDDKIDFSEKHHYISSLSHNECEEEEEEDDDFFDESELILQMEKENLSYGSRFGYKIQDVIKPNQYILVQVVKEERGNKGASLTTYLSIPGKYCVLIPYSNFEGGISKKIHNSQDRQRLKKIIASMAIPENTNVILRTACLDKSDEQILQDYKYISHIWEIIKKQMSFSKKPGILFEDGSLVKKVIRDLYSGDIEEIVIEGKQAYESAISFAKALAPDIIKKIKKFHHPKLSLFRYYNIEESVKNIYSPVVFLKSGGYIVIHPTEALVSIDVNSGKSRGKRNIEETAIKTNIEAAIEIMQQIRLRDIGGLIIIDFIDMENPKNRSIIEKKIKELARLDKAKLQINPISSFGLLEISRQRIKASILERSFHICPKCQGVGYIRPLELNALQILKNIESDVSNNRVRASSDMLILKMPTEESFYLLNNKRLELTKLETILKTSIKIECDDTITFPFYQFEEPIIENEAETISFLEKELENNRAIINTPIENSNSNNKNSRGNKNNRKATQNKSRDSRDDNETKSWWLKKLLRF